MEDAAGREAIYAEVEAEMEMIGDWKYAEFRIADTVQLAEFRRGRGPDKKPRKRRGLGTGLAVAGLGTVGLGGAGAAIATSPSRAEQRVNRTVRAITREPKSSLMGDVSDPEYLARIEGRKASLIKKASGGSDEAMRGYQQIMQTGQVTKEQKRSLTKIASRQNKIARRAKVQSLARRFGNRKALIGLGVGAGVAAIAGAAVGLSRKPKPRYYDYY